MFALNCQCICAAAEFNYVRYFHFAIERRLNFLLYFICERLIYDSSYLFTTHKKQSALAKVERDIRFKVNKEASVILTLLQLYSLKEMIHDEGHY